MIADKSKIIGDDIVLSLKWMTNKSPLSSSGLIDKRLFTGGNRLHAIRGTDNLWYLQYDSGALEEPLKQKFTNFPILMAHVKKHFHKRNIEVTEDYETT